MPTVQIESGVPVLRLSTPSGLETAVNWAKSLPTDVVHVHQEMLWDVAKDMVGDSGAKTVLSLHLVQAILNRIRGVDRTTLSLTAQEKAIASADVVIAPSMAVFNEILTIYPNAGGRLRVVQQGVEPCQYVANDSRRTGAREDILYAGRFAFEKGTDVLLSAIGPVAVRRPTARFVVAGGLPDSPRYERRWQRRFRSAGQEFGFNTVELPGWLDSAELDKRLRAAAIFVSPGRHETFGQGAIEAMARGTPVVASRAGGLVEVISHEETGILVEPGDPEALATGILRVLADPEGAREMGARAAKFVEEKLTWDRAIGRLIDVYEGDENSK